MKVIIVEREPLKVVGLKIKTNINANEIPQLWNEFIVRTDELEKNAVPDCSLGICIYKPDLNEQNETEFSYMACKVVKEDSKIPKGMEYRELPPQLVAVFTHIGSLDNLSETYDYIYDKWLPESDYTLIEADEIEWYDARFKYGEEDSQMDIHIPIAKKTLDDLTEDLIF
ncbi:MAG: GyrI-like domain-containing protein [Candidatus Cloacimonetes bacterium]|nr:GyrI-like domain-containing protein [Candidatus Cloacimonadota bacterium]